MPRSRSPAMTSQAARRADGSKPVVGSSRKISSGSPISASATSSRRRWPPESAVARCVGLLCEVDERERLIDAGAVRGSSRRRASRHSRTVRPGSASDSCSTIPIRSRQADGACHGSAPSTSTCRSLAWRKPSRISTVVVLPAPLGPRKAKISPRRDLEVDAADRLVVAVALAQAADRDDRIVGGRRRRTRARRWATAASSEFVSMAATLGRQPTGCHRRSGSNLRLHPWVEDRRAGSTRRPMTHRARAAYRSTAHAACALQMVHRQQLRPERDGVRPPRRSCCAASLCVTWSRVPRLTRSSTPASSRTARPRRGDPCGDARAASPPLSASQPQSAASPRGIASPRSSP